MVLKNNFILEKSLLFNIIDKLTITLANWDFWSLFVLLILIISISYKNLLGTIGLSFLVFKILGFYWGIGFSIVGLIACVLEFGHRWLKSKAIEMEAALLENMNKNINEIKSKLSQNH